MASTVYWHQIVLKYEDTIVLCVSQPMLAGLGPYPDALKYSAHFEFLTVCGKISPSLVAMSCGIIICVLKRYPLAKMISAVLLSQTVQPVK